MQPYPQIHVFGDYHPDSNGPLLRGISAYAQAKGPWRITLRPPLLDSAALVGAAGVIYKSASPAIIPKLTALGLPVVRVLTVDHVPPEMQPPPDVSPDDEAIGRMGARHLLESGMKSFAFCGADAEWSHLRERGFADVIRRAGYPVTLLGRRRRLSWSRLTRRRVIERWVARLARPVAIMACSDDIAVRILDAGRLLGRRVPEDLAVLGVNNNETLCEFNATPISSIGRELERVGYEAAGALDRLMRGDPVPPDIRVPPVRVVRRRSSDLLAAGDAEVAAAIRFIRDNALRNITVEDVLNACAVSRSTLERRFRALLQRSPGDEIRRVRLEHARDLVLRTYESLTDIAARCGFADLAHFSHSFRAAFGHTPSKYRKQFVRGG